MAIDNYYDRTNPGKKYRKHLFRAGAGLQSAELNEIQEEANARIRSVADAIFADGAIVKDCAILVDPVTGAATLNAGSLYLQGMVRGVAPANLVIPVDRTVYVGIRLLSSTVTEFEDPDLRDPAVGTRNFGEPGAGRLREEPVWGWDGDGVAADFFPVYTVESGTVLSKEAPPQLDGVTVALARYDRDSAGGAYVISGLEVSAAFDAGNSKITTLVSEGRARVNGFGVELVQSVRLIETMDRDLQAVLAEPRTFTPDGSGNMRIDTDFGPVVSVDAVRITAEKTVTITHGPYSGAQDPLPDTSVLSIQSVTQGGTTYVQGTDYRLTSGKVDWSLAGAEPAPGSSYSVTYRYQTTVAPTSVDSTGFTVSGAVSGTLVTTDYSFALPRVDAIALDDDGRVSRIKGVASIYNPAAPAVPSTMLRIATLSHTWDGNPAVTRDAVAVMPMDQIQALKGMILNLYEIQAQEQLRNSISLTDPAAKRGVFVDPFANDNVRDSGVAQSAAIIDGELVLPISETLADVGDSITAPVLLDFTAETLIEQPYRTGSMLVNPYQAFAPMPARVSLTPAVDHWTVVDTVWRSPVTRRFTVGAGNSSRTTKATASELISSNTVSSQYLRQITVRFSVAGFASGEVLSSVTFDGVPVTPEAI